MSDPDPVTLLRARVGLLLRLAFGKLIFPTLTRTHDAKDTETSQENVPLLRDKIVYDSAVASMQGRENSLCFDEHVYGKLILVEREAASARQR